MNTLRVATWNVHGAVGLDRRCDPARIARIVVELDADVVALQEVWLPRGRTADFCVMLAGASGLHCTFAPTFDKRGQPFGNALLRRASALRDEVVDLAIGRREPRNAIDALLDLDGMRLRVVATHLGLAATERHVQAGWLAQRVRADRTPCVVLGDFNEWRAVGALAPLRDMVAGRAPATFPSALPIASLDRILAQPASLVRERHVPASPLVRIASDHRPLIATIALDRLA